MKDAELKEKFIKLRAEGASFDTCAKELEKSKNTLMKWNQELSSEINNLVYLTTQNISEQYKLTRQKKLEFLAKEIDKINEALANKNYDELSVKEIITLKEKFENDLKNEISGRFYKTGEYIKVNPFELPEFGEHDSEITIGL